MAVSNGICCTNVALTLFTGGIVPPNTSWTLLFILGGATVPPGTYITSPPISVIFIEGENVTTSLVQTRVSAALISGYSVSNVDIDINGLTMTICTPSSTQIVDQLYVQFYSNTD